MNEKKGLIHLYIGSGKGKTTAAAGLCVRMRGTGRQVLFAQFLKGQPSAEVEPLRRLGIQVERTDPVKKFIKSMNEEEYSECCRSCRALFERAERALQSGEYGLVALDEVLDAVGHGIIGEEELLQALESRSPATEAVLTGRNPGQKLCELADYISDMQAVKHPYQKGITARAGIEY